MKSKLILLFSILSISLFAQIPNNQKQWFTNTVLLDSTTRLYVGTVGSGQIIKDVLGNGTMTWVQPEFVDSLWIKTDSICYSNGITNYCLYLSSGGGPGGNFVDSLYQNGDSICYNISSNNYCFFNKSFGVDSIYRKAGIDSIFYTKNNFEYSIKDSIGGSNSSLSINDTIINSTTGGVLFTNANNLLRQNAQRLFWDTISNNLGIGLNNPTARLTVKGNHINSSSFSLAVHDSTGSSNALIIRNDNMVGFGNSTPSARVHISGTGDLLRVNNGATGIFINTSSGVVFRAVSNHFIRFQNYLGSNVISYDMDTVTLHKGCTIVGNLIINTTSGGVLLPRLTTAQINAIVSPDAGLTVYNTTENTVCFFNGTNWQKVTSTNL